MSSDALRRLAPVTDADIRAAARLLGLPENAFHGADGFDPRCAVLKCMSSIDVTACPGSGKTTLLVAKLAILARKWTERTRGICVLSHTNVARREIEVRLGNSAVGRTLLGYPHFIGTIHSFLNEFMAIPWLRSLKYPIRMIDSGFCEAWRWKRIPRCARYALEKKEIEASDLCMASTDFSPQKKHGAFPFRAHTPTWQHVRNALHESARAGYFCHEDTFLWAAELLDKDPSIASILRERFPLLLIDETQDNSEIQSAMLHRVFMAGGSSVVRQRFGDPNQAIFSFRGKPATTDAFPESDSRVVRQVPSSYRFGDAIANLVKPLAVAPCDLIGRGPRGSDGAPRFDTSHTLFLFRSGGALKVLQAYAQLLLDTFTERELREGTFTAVGHIHTDTGDDDAPRHIGHYWPAYNPGISRAAPLPQTFVEHVSVAQAAAEDTGDVSAGVQKIAEGLLHLARLAATPSAARPVCHAHQHVLEMLEHNRSSRRCYEVVLSQLALKRRALTRRSWNARWRELIRGIGEAIAGGPLVNVDCRDFLAWPDEALQPVPRARVVSRRGNLFDYPDDSTRVSIRVASIHSVKGETHTATLVLETYLNGSHNLEAIKEWLLGGKTGGLREKKTTRDRLRLHYVAVTRPSHLLCVAMRRASFENAAGDLDLRLIQELQTRGWRVQELH